MLGGAVQCPCETIQRVGEQWKSTDKRMDLRGSTVRSNSLCSCSSNSESRLTLSITSSTASSLPSLPSTSFLPPLPIFLPPPCDPLCSTLPHHARWSARATATHGITGSWHHLGRPSGFWPWLGFLPYQWRSKYTVCYLLDKIRKTAS